jgi:hypothetical protein
MKVTIIGGGHFSYPLSDFLIETKHEIDVLYIPADNGGHTGLVNRLLEHDDRKFNKILHNYAIPVLPWGDINKLIGFFLEKKFSKELKELYEKRHVMIQSQNQELYSQVESTLNKFCKHFNFDEETCNESKNYIFACIKQINKVYDRLDYKYFEGPISSFFNNYVYSNGHSVEIFNNFYKELDVLPYNINLHFIYKDRLTLEGIDSHNSLITGEDNIDTHELPIDPCSFKLIKPDKSEINDNDLKFLISKLQSSDLIIFPNGSIANWLPLCKYETVRKVLEDKAKNEKLICFLNLFRTKNELPFADIYNYLKNLGIPPIVIGSRLQNILKEKYLLKEYEEKEDKTLNDLESMAIDFYMGTLAIETEKTNPNIEGVKYTPASVNRILNFILK